MKTPILGTFAEQHTEDHLLGPMQKLDFPMHRFKPDEEVDFCIVGVGSAGDLLSQHPEHVSDETPPVRKSLSPKGTAGHGVPRLKSLRGNTSKRNILARKVER